MLPRFQHKLCYQSYIAATNISGRKGEFNVKPL